MIANNHYCQIAVRRSIKDEDRNDPTLLTILALAKAIDVQITQIRQEIQDIPSKTYMRRPR